MSIPRFRMFAGPNGSGKTTFYESLRNGKIIHTEIYISADRIEEILLQHASFNFNSFHIKVNQADFFEYVTNSGLFLSNKFENNFLQCFEIISGILYIRNTTINSYHASFIATYLVEKLLEIKASFCFETVMCHPSKLDILAKAKKIGYKTYFYFLFTDDVNININRIKKRVAYGKHNVSDEKVINRFFKTFENVKKAIVLSDSVFLLNNTNRIAHIEFHKNNNKIVNTIPKNGLLQKYI